ncbi:MAG TPA: hypothetical protein VFA12_20185 [Stellaceae bacterium]|nr:hypothetical protein [Stellaceae bacterium]
MSDAIGPTIAYAGPAAEAPAVVQQPIGGTPEPEPIAVAPVAPEAPTPRPKITPDGLLIDEKGRRLRLRELSYLDELDLLELAGARTENGSWMVQLVLAARVAEIDGAKVPFPRNGVQLRSMFQMVDRSGVRAVREHLESQIDNADSDEAIAKN